MASGAISVKGPLIMAETRIANLPTQKGLLELATANEVKGIRAS